MSLLALLVLTGVWSFAEAVLWFIVADVPISWIAVRFGLKPALLAAVIAALASVPGGWLTYELAQRDYGALASAMASLPAIDAAMIAEAASAHVRSGWLAMLEASFSGVPYKLFALAEAREGRDLGAFLLASPFVRLPRFAAVALVAAGGSALARRLSLRLRLALLAALWLIFYAGYFAAMPA